MEVDIFIDRITDCLIDTRTGEKVETEYRMREMPIRPKDYKGWKFNWSITEKNGYHIYMRKVVIMLAIQRKSAETTHDISYYAKDSRLTGEPDGKRYKWKEMIERFKLLGRPLTEEEAEEFRIK